MSISGATWFTAGSSVSVTGNAVSRCSASVTGGSTVYGFNAYGGAISTYVGTYAYAFATTNSAIVMQGDTNAQGSVHTYNLNRIWECTASAVVLNPSGLGSSCFGELRVKGAC